jgi:predicted transcriptional regulator
MVSGLMTYVEGAETGQFLCGYLKSRIYFSRPNNLEDLRHRIRAEMEQISFDIIERSVQTVGECQMVVGG